MTCTYIYLCTRTCMYMYMYLFPNFFLVSSPPCGHDANKKHKDKENKFYFQLSINMIIVCTTCVTAMGYVDMYPDYPDYRDYRDYPDPDCSICRTSDDL